MTVFYDQFSDGQINGTALKSSKTTHWGPKSSRRRLRCIIIESGSYQNIANGMWFLTASRSFRRVNKPIFVGFKLRYNFHPTKNTFGNFSQISTIAITQTSGDHRYINNLSLSLKDHKKCKTSNGLLSGSTKTWNLKDFVGLELNKIRSATFSTLIILTKSSKIIGTFENLISIANNATPLMNQRNPINYRSSRYINY
jgi:hypothetical protein